MEYLNLALGNSLLLVLVVIECVVIRFILKEQVPWKEIIANISSGHILLWLIRGLEIAAYYYTAKYLSLHLLDSLPSFVVWIIGFLLWDFCFYWLHRFNHSIKLFWSIHAVHHEGEHYSLSLGIRNSWYSSFASYPFFAGMAILGVPYHIYLVVASIHYFIQFYNHTHIVKNSYWLDYILITPTHHRVHHGKNDPYIDKNFGGTLVFWDKLFGTFQKELPENPVEVGLKNTHYTYNPFWMNNIPVFRYLGISFSVPKAKKLNKPPTDKMLIMGAITLFVLLISFINYEQVLSLTEKFILFGVLFIGTFGLGGMSENNRWGLYCWIISSIFLPVIMLLNMNLDSSLMRFFLLIIIIQGLLSLINHSKFSLHSIKS